MKRMFEWSVASVGGYLAYAVGAHGGILVGFLASLVGTAAGLILGRRIAGTMLP